MAKIKTSSRGPCRGCGSTAVSEFYIDKRTKNWFTEGKDTGVRAEGKDGKNGDPYIPNEETGTYWFEGKDTGISIYTSNEPQSDDEVFF